LSVTISNRGLGSLTISNTGILSVTISNRGLGSGDKQDACPTLCGLNASMAYQTKFIR
jgi:hypothetical protein